MHWPCRVASLVTPQNYKEYQFLEAKATAKRYAPTSWFQTASLATDPIQQWHRVPMVCEKHATTIPYIILGACVLLAECCSLHWFLSAKAAAATPAAARMLVQPAALSDTCTAHKHLLLVLLQQQRKGWGCKLTLPQLPTLPLLALRPIPHLLLLALLTAPTSTCCLLLTC
jgi:hypothetical protein